MNKTSCMTSVGLIIVALGHASAQSIDEWDFINPNVYPVTHYSDSNGVGVPDISEAIFVGTSSNNNIAAGTLNDVFTVETNNTSQSILAANGVWGATADALNQRILFTQSSESEPPAGIVGGGDNLFELLYTGGTPQLLGRITLAGAGLRVDGLAMRQGVLYGVNAATGTTNGFYQINLDTLEATLIADFPDSISGLDADPESCIIYGTNDTTGQVVRLDPSGNIEDLVAYPVGIIDIDGIAVGEGYAYLITDEDQDFAVLNLATLQYETPLTSPFNAADTFSAGALAIQDPANDSNVLFKNGFEINYCVDIE